MSTLQDVAESPEFESSGIMKCYEKPVSKKTIFEAVNEMRESLKGEKKEEMLSDEILGF